MQILRDITRGRVRYFSSLITYLTALRWLSLAPGHEIDSYLGSFSISEFFCSMGPEKLNPLLLLLGLLVHPSIAPPPMLEKIKVSAGYCEE